MAGSESLPFAITIAKYAFVGPRGAPVFRHMTSPTRKRNVAADWNVNSPADLLMREQPREIFRLVYSDPWRRIFVPTAMLWSMLTCIFPKNEPGNP